MPDRGERPRFRISVTVRLPAEIITRAAEHVHATEPLFIIGATLARMSAV